MQASPRIDGSGCEIGGGDMGNETPPSLFSFSQSNRSYRVTDFVLACSGMFGGGPIESKVGGRRPNGFLGLSLKGRTILSDPIE